MKYTRNQINKAGEVIMTSKDSQEVTLAIEMLNDWRTNHLVPLNLLGNEVIQILFENNITPILTSQRLKRLTSIQYKLDLNPTMKLGGMQDIGGFRIILKDVSSLQKTLTLLSNKIITNFTLEKSTITYKSLNQVVIEVFILFTNIIRIIMHMTG